MGEFTQFIHTRENTDIWPICLVKRWSDARCFALEGVMAGYTMALVRKGFICSAMAASNPAGSLPTNHKRETDYCLK